MEGEHGSVRQHHVATLAQLLPNVLLQEVNRSKVQSCTSKQMSLATGNRKRAQYQPPHRDVPSFKCQRAYLAVRPGHSMMDIYPAYRGKSYEPFLLRPYPTHAQLFPKVGANASQLENSSNSRVTKRFILLCMQSVLTASTTCTLASRVYAPRCVSMCQPALLDAFTSRSWTKLVAVFTWLL